ncbi:unnamed protein product [Chironomus riparius]|uniref:Ionotropic receptor n=1 Tax=Chironomus riparius TaxID=315576 RepID=A0A9N9WVQ4_9DIPT|nr:unnamed protein product [Chironomus riparius]
MRITQIFILLILTTILSTTETLQIDQNLSNYVCKIIKDLLKSNSSTQDVLIGNIGGKMWSSTINYIAGCVGHKDAVVVSDFKKPLTEKTLRKASIIVLALGWADQVRFKNIYVAQQLKFSLNIQNTVIATVRTHIHSKVWNHKAKVMLIVKNNLNFNQRMQILKMLVMYGFLDSAIIHETKNGAVKFEIFATMKRNIRTLTNPEQSDLVFPDKLRDMNGHMYTILAYNQVPRVIINNNKVSSTIVPFMHAVTKLQNSRHQLYIIKDLREFRKLWMDRSFDFSLSYGVFMDSSEPKLQTYEENGYCALVPLPPKTTFFQSIIIEPFDGLTWLFFFLTIACSVAVWWMFRGRGAVDSPWLLGYGMFVMFIGQGVDFSRKNRLVLDILLELIIVMVWILCNAYEGVISSFMIQPIHEQRLQTFDDLVASDHVFMSDNTFASLISGSDSFKLLNSRLDTSVLEKSMHLSLELVRQHWVFFITCDQAEIILDKKLMQINQTVSELYYLLPEKFLPFLIDLEASYLNPFLERFQYYMDISFQAGLPYIWKVFYSKINPYKKIYSFTDEFEYLKLEDFTQVFTILISGYVLSFGLILIEIFFHDILKKLELACLARKLRNRVHQMAYKKRKQPKHPKYQRGALYYIIHRRKRVKRLKPKKLKIRRIYVQPRFSMD